MEYLLLRYTYLKAVSFVFVESKSASIHVSINDGVIIYLWMVSRRYQWWWELVRRWVVWVGTKEVFAIHEWMEWKIFDGWWNATSLIYMR